MGEISKGFLWETEKEICSLKGIRPQVLTHLCALRTFKFLSGNCELKIACALHKNRIAKKQLCHSTIWQNYHCTKVPPPFPPTSLAYDFRLQMTLKDVAWSTYQFSGREEVMCLYWASPSCTATRGCGELWTMK